MGTTMALATIRRRRTSLPPATCSTAFRSNSKYATIWSSLKQCFLVTLFLVLTCNPSQAQYSEDVKSAIDVIVLFCVAGGHAFTIEGTGAVEGGLALRKVGVAGSADITLSKSEAQGLVEGLKGEMNSITGQQALEARECMRPYTDKITCIILGEQNTGQTTTTHLYDEARLVGEWQWVVGPGYVQRILISRKTEENVNRDGDVWYARYAGQIQSGYGQVKLLLMI